MALYRSWGQAGYFSQCLRDVFDNSLKQPVQLWARLLEANSRTVYDVYNVATDYATHQTRSVRTAFNWLERINAAFRKRLAFGCLTIIAKIFTSCLRLIAH
jgi:hypothetical protein